MPDWAVQQLRVSLFSSDAVSLSEAHWKKLTGVDEAESRTAIAGGKLYSGKHLGGLFSVGFSGARCDIALSNDDSLAEPDAEPKLPAYGKWEELLPAFLASITPFVEGFEFSVIRLAFGAALLAPTSSKEDAYLGLAKLLRSVKIDAERMREFIFRVNWPQPSAVMADLELNRLTTWSAIVVARAAMQITGAELSVGATTAHLHAMRLDMDHNTSQAHKGAFGKDVRVPILQELITMARKNAEAGEHP